MLTEISYPVTGSSGSYQNTFPSQVPLSWDFSRKDIGITSISSGTNNVVRIEADASFGTIEVGQFVSWGSDAYSVRSNRVTAIISATEIEVDQPFTSTDATNGFVNYHLNYFVEIRFVEFGSSTDQQDALEFIDDYVRVPSAPNGDVSAVINTAGQLLVPDFDIQTGVADGLFLKYKVQYRESWEGDRSQNWISPAVDVPIFLVHASAEIDQNEYVDVSLHKKYTRFYPLVYSFIYSDVNDNSNTVKLSYKELALDKTEIQTVDVVSLLNFYGVYLVVIDTNALDPDTVFIQFDSLITTSNGQYDPAQYDGAQYA